MIGIQLSFTFSPIMLISSPHKRSTLDKKDKIADCVPDEEGSGNRHNQIPEGLREIQNGGRIGGPHREDPSFQGKYQEKDQGHEIHDDVQDTSSPASSQPVGDHVHPKVSPFFPQQGRAEEHHPGKSKFNDLIGPSHGRYGNETGRTSPQKLK